MLSATEDIFITKNGKVIAKLSNPFQDRVDIAKSLFGIIPDNITLEEAQELYNEILDWYDHELKTYDPSVNALMELSDPGTGCVVEGISYHSIMEGLSILQTSNETDQKLICQPAGKHDG